MRPVIIYSIFLTLVAGSLIYTRTQHFKRVAAAHLPKTESGSAFANSNLVAVREKANQAKSYIATNGFNQQICFLVDMNMHSGSNRFFVYDLKKDSLRNAGPVTHGRCNEEWLEGRKYGNTVGCGCTSLGKYKIGKSYHGQFGLAYKLHGLDQSNNNAFKRYVVLHSHECVPATAVEEDICQSDGCPTVSPQMLAYLKPIIDRSTRPILLWIYDSGARM